MKAVRLHGYGGVDQLRYEDAPMPEPRPDEVLVRVLSTSINPIDLKMRSGAAKDRFPVTFPAILGRDVAGEVVKVGGNVSTFKAGDKVMGLVTESYAEFLTARAHVLTHIPQGLDVLQAGAYPLVATTGDQLAGHLVLKRGDKALVTGALGGVGRTAVYVAKQRGAHVIAGVRPSKKARRSRSESIAWLRSTMSVTSPPCLPGSIPLRTPSTGRPLPS
jgi:NADPH:quinone reductase-like Zn-dependent oxidoreductase